MTGIKEEDLNKAVSPCQINQDLTALLANRRLIGYQLDSFLEQFRISHSAHLLRDISLYTPFCPSPSRPLRCLVRTVLAKSDFQQDQQCSVCYPFGYSALFPVLIAILFLHLAG
jgi:hypothetical protein